MTPAGAKPDQRDDRLHGGVFERLLAAVVYQLEGSGQQVAFTTKTTVDDDNATISIASKCSTT